ncbi:MAG: hypothetical protein IIC24_10645, partial [Chloroflexi bacterium]|nr:hypothetical protein [Chloroflexota bacterium]
MNYQTTLRARKERPAILCGGLMIRISIPYFVRIGRALDNIHTIKAGDGLRKEFGKLITAENALEGLLDEHNVVHAMRSSVPKGRVLLQALKKLTAASMDKTLDFMDIHSITSSAREFVTVFNAEMEVADTYF